MQSKLQLKINIAKNFAISYFFAKNLPYIRQTLAIFSVKYLVTLVDTVHIRLIVFRTHMLQELFRVSWCQCLLQIRTSLAILLFKPIQQTC